jgi:phospholipase C
MGTRQTATVYITNNTDGNAWIELYHQNSTNGTQSGRWFLAPGAQAGPLTVNFETGWDVGAVMDYWWVYLTVTDGSAPGQYVSGGTTIDPGWKECQLKSADAGQTLKFSVSTSIFNINEDSGACSNGMNKIGAYSPITNIFVVMLENRSFDIMLAMSGISHLTVATTNDSNSYGDPAVTVNITSGNAPLSMPTDPGHEFLDVLQQLTGDTIYNPGAYPTINNGGFAETYATSNSEKTGLPIGSDQVADIMACFDTSNQLPVMYQLATEFAVCDHWYSSLPGPTWPNRFFLHGASSSGLDHSPSTTEISGWETADGFTYTNGSIFDAFNNAGVSWRLYNDCGNVFSDDPGKGSLIGAIPQVASLKRLSLLDVDSLANLASDLQNPYPYAYTFIEPNYGNVVDNTYEGGSSQHPMDDVYGGEGLLKYVYESIRNSPVWDTSLLIITYDEHGGFYDSVAPPAAPAPRDGNNTYNQYNFNFEQYGVRVPAIIVSPLIAANTVDHTVYDHTSVLATAETYFNVGSLTQRDAQAKNLMHLCSLTSPRTDCPTTLNNPAKFMQRSVTVPSAEEMAANDLQPISETGSLPGFLHVMLKTDIELSAQTDAEKIAIIARFKLIRTRGEAKAYIAYVQGKVAAAKAARGKK